MECPSCGFQNMPGSEDCPRCGSSLRLATMVMDVNPPRAGKWQRLRRRLLPIDGFIRRSRSRTAIAGRRSLAAARIAADPVVDMGRQAMLGVFQWRAIIPGWLQMRDGRRQRGQMFLFPFLILLVPTVLLFGTTFGSLFLGLAIGIHAASALDQMNYHLPACSRQERTNRWFVMLGVIALTVYWPMWWLVSRVADASVVGRTNGALHQGDVVLIDHWLPRRIMDAPGALVVYNVPEQSRSSPGNEGLYITGGENIDRVLAVGPAKIVWKDGSLWVDGKPSALQPLSLHRIPSGMAFDLPDGDIFILPSAWPIVPTEGDTAGWEYLSILPRETAEGRVYLRYQPLWRFGLIR